MNLSNRLIPAICLLFLFGCAAKKQPGADSPSANAADSQPARIQKTPAKNIKPGNEVSAVPAARNKPDGKTSAALPTGSKLDGKIVGTPAPRSKFAKLRLGMSKKQVEKLIGKPSVEKSIKPEKTWTPSYFNKDTPRIEATYKREGQLTFAGTDSSGILISIVVNPKQSGRQ